MENAGALVVTTSHQGVFFGYGSATEGDTIWLDRCRMCIYWPEENHGVVGLASVGPLTGSKVGPAAPSIQIRDITAIIRVTDKAKAAWESEPWR